MFQTDLSSFLAILKVIEIKEIEILKAFKYITKFETLKAVEEDLKKEKIIKINRDINKTGENLTFENRNQQSLLESKVIFIRYMLQEIEKKRGRITKKIIDKLAHEMSRAKIYNNKIEKEKITDEIETLLKYIYNLSKDGRISSTKT